MAHEAQGFVSIGVRARQTVGLLMMVAWIGLVLGSRRKMKL
jgi:hypothetical protein